MGYIELNKSFPLIWSILQEIDKKKSHYCPKKIFSSKLDTSAKRTFLVFRSFFFEKWQKNISFKVKKSFSHQNEPHTAKLSFSIVMKHFRFMRRPVILFSDEISVCLHFQYSWWWHANSANNHWTNPFFSSGFAPFKHGKKIKLSEFFNARFCDSLLCLKRKVRNEFPQKYFKTKERYSLAVCGSLCGDKQFLLIFIPFYWFDQKQLFKQILIFLSFFLYQTW